MSAQTHSSAQWRTVKISNETYTIRKSVKRCLGKCILKVPPSSMEPEAILDTKGVCEEKWWKNDSRGTIVYRSETVQKWYPEVAKMIIFFKDKKKIPKMFWDAGHRTLLLPNAVLAHSPLGQPCSYHSHSSRGLELRGEWMQWTRERAHNFYRKMPRVPYSRTQGSVALLKYIFLINFLFSFEWYRSHCKSLPFVIEHYCQFTP